MALTTLAAVKQYKGITGVELDALITALIPRVSAAVETYLSRKVESQAHVEYRDGNNGVTLPLRQAPVTAVAAVLVDGVAIPSGGFTQPGWRITGQMLVLNGYRFTVGHGNVEIQYTAGFSTVPADIEQAAIEAIVLTMERRSHLDVSSKSLAGETISYITSDLPPSARKLLEPYRRVAPL